MHRYVVGCPGYTTTVCNKEVVLMLIGKLYPVEVQDLIMGNSNKRSQRIHYPLVGKAIGVTLYLRVKIYYIVFTVVKSLEVIANLDVVGHAHRVSTIVRITGVIDSVPGNGMRTGREIVHHVCIINAIHLVEKRYWTGIIAIGYRWRLQVESGTAGS